MSQPTFARSDNGSLFGAEHFGKYRNCEREILTQDITRDVESFARFYYLPLSFVKQSRPPNLQTTIGVGSGVINHLFNSERSRLIHGVHQVPEHPLPYFCRISWHDKNKCRETAKWLPPGLVPQLRTFLIRKVQALPPPSPPQHCQSSPCRSAYKAI